VNLRLRLSLWYAALLATLLLLFSIATYAVASASILIEIEKSTAAQAQEINALIHEAEQLNTNLPPLSIFQSQYFIQIVDNRKRIIQRSPNLGDEWIPVPKSIFTETLQDKATFFTVKGENSTILVYIQPITFYNKTAGAVLVAHDLHDAERALSTIRHMLIFGTLLGIFMAGIISYILARKALSPLDRVANTAAQISNSSNLGLRMPTPKQKDEVGQLITTFNHMLERLQAAFDGQQQLVADISHELRTPLTTIQGNIQLLNQHQDMDEEERNAIFRDVNNEVYQMKRLIDDLLLLAQADRGLQVEKEPFEFNDLFLEVYRETKAMSTGQNIRLGNVDAGIISGDRHRLKQLFLNLSQNAVRYTPAGGEIVFSWQKENNWAVVFIKDSGIGIAPEDLPHIFERFYRTEKARSRAGGGTGLGLSIAQWVAEAHGGSIDVESEPGQGTTFTVRLPLSPEDREASDG